MEHKNFENIIAEQVELAAKSLFDVKLELKNINVQKTNKEFKGHLTVVIFPLMKLIGQKNPVELGNQIGEWLKKNTDLVEDFNVVKGFLNLVISNDYWVQTLHNIDIDKTFGIKTPNDSTPVTMVEYSSPNTNKPLHLGHIRNILLGDSLSRILKANGKNVFKTNIVNDRGIHICKSMLAWEKYGNGETPESSGLKGDHLVGKYYVEFDKHYKEEINNLMKSKDLTKEQAEAQSTLMKEAREMLLKWENNDPHVMKLWDMMNKWVYDGFEKTYERLGVDFDKIYYESSTYIDGREVVLKGLQDGILYQKEDKSIWADLTPDGLDHKLLLRGDGTSVYMTQDIGTAKQRFNEHDIEKMVYVVGNEQNYHFQVLALVLDKLGFNFGKDLTHFSYGMIELPDGKMKSREGTVVDADDLMDEMISTAKKTSEELGKLDECTPQEIENITTMIGLGALKYFILKVDPRKNMVFNPNESIDFNGNTAPFIQYTHARIKSVLRNAKAQGIDISDNENVKLSLDTKMTEKEQNIVQQLAMFSNVIKQAADEYSPALIANYTYELVKEYNQFYHDHGILKEQNEDVKKMRLILSKNVAKIISQSMKLLGIDVPERM